MRQTYAVRSLILAAGLVFVGLAVIVQMIRIQNSEQAKIFLSQVTGMPVSSAWSIRSAERFTTAVVTCWRATAQSMKWA